MDKHTHRRGTERRAFGIFIASLAATMVVLFAGFFIGTAVRNARQLDDTILASGRALFQELVLARRWAAGYGGVYVRKGPGVESNPWLVDPDLQAADGSWLTLRNPSLMTREISELATAASGFSFRITSLRPINPGNAPDAFEREALARFESGATEHWATVDSPAGLEFRYMGALPVEESCLACHAVQGYRVGDVRGGISVTIPAENVHRERARTELIMALASAVILAATLALVYAFVASLRRKLEKARAELELAAVTDPLTGMYNRRYGMDRFQREVEKAARLGTPISCAILDADDFKKLNDTLGHLTGDAALKTVASCLQAGLRSYDMAMRYGGEEFVLVLPGVRAEEALSVCERMRQRIEERGRESLPEGAALSVSVGITAYYPPSDAAAAVSDKPDPAAIMDELLKKADSAMYRAKTEGKNRCILG